ncbi:hypothetical protein T4D_260 [Trichinella pseudospiralis]|uniref:Uncharacterized protein n=1 Tax=Trichinella pseudospiralis TaxID=6337 RepID=A0A0V1G0M2_TRIPS|nr:hypothetical protein T4D_260 [Trichinella pseudospiralis]
MKIMNRTPRDVNFYLHSMAVRKHVFSRDTSDCTYEEIKKNFELFHQPKVKIFTARIESGKINRHYGESIMDYVSRLMEGSAKCNFGKDFDKRLLCSLDIMQNCGSIEWLTTQSLIGRPYG